MAQSTEAACLLQSGSMYPRRLGARTASGGDLFAGVKPGGVSVYFDDAPIYHFDLDGRWQRAFVDGVHYLKGLDATVRSIDRERDGVGLVLRRETLPFAVASDLDASIRSVALGLIDDLDSGRLEPLPVPSKARSFGLEEFRAFLERVVGWDSAAWFAHRERYLSTYGPMPFLPPDCPNALVLQLTLGDLDGRAFARGPAAEHYVRSRDEFLEHARAVASLVGRRVSQYRGVFLAGADALRRPIDEVIGALETIAEVFPSADDANSPIGDDWDDRVSSLGKVHAFLDDFAAGLPDVEGWRALRAAGLEQVTLGVESGDRAIRSLFGKGWEDDELLKAVEGLKAAEIRVGLVVLVGPGGRDRADRHVEATASRLESLPLGPGELVTLVDARSLEATPLEGVESLSDEETAAQVATLKGRLAATRGKLAPKLVAYNPLKRWA